MEPIEAPVVILGAGPAGLTAAYELCRHGVPSVVLERSSTVGGLAQTAEYKGYLFDIGGHRFFTKVPLIEQIWKDVLGDDFLARPRLSRIFYKSKFFHYPLEPWDVIRGLGLVEITLCGLSFLKAHLLPERPEDNFETWVSNRFGRRLFHTFFESYTEKVWGIPCRQIRAEWAAQRIRGLSFISLVRSALQGNHGERGAIKTLIKEFHYPRRGPGMMWTRMKEIVEKKGAQVILNAPVERIDWTEGRVTGVVAGGKLYRGEHFVSSLPIRQLIEMLNPAPPEPLRLAAQDFHYRDFVTVALIVKGNGLFPDNWIYVHDPNVAVGRIQNYGNWSPEMTPDPETSCLGLEYFCFEGDGLWSMDEKNLISMAGWELSQLGLVDPAAIVDGTVVRMPKAYPVYDETYQLGLTTVQAFLPKVQNLQLVGRNGMHRYNNQDHSMLTALLAARNILGARYDLWQLHVDSDYLEEGVGLSEEDLKGLEATQPMTPTRFPPASARLR